MCLDKPTRFKLGKLISKVEAASKEIPDVFDKLSLEWGLSYDGIVKAIPFLELASQAHVIPVSWILGDDITPFFEEVTQCEISKSEFTSKRTELDVLYQKIALNENSIEASNTDILANAESVTSELSRLTHILSGSFPYSNWSNNFF